MFFWKQAQKKWECSKAEAWFLVWKYLREQFSCCSFRWVILPLVQELVCWVFLMPVIVHQITAFAAATRDTGCADFWFTEHKIPFTPHRDPLQSCCTARGKGSLHTTEIPTPPSSEAHRTPTNRQHSHRAPTNRRRPTEPLQTGGVPTEPLQTGRVPQNPYKQAGFPQQVMAVAVPGGERGSRSPREG